MVNIRSITQEDMPLLLYMGRLMHEESPRFSVHPFIEERAAQTIQYIINNDSGFIAQDNERVVGMIGGALVPHYFSNVVFANDLAVYVTPEYRGGRAALLLVKAFEDWAMRNGAIEIVLGLSTGINPERTGKFYERLGYNLSCHNYLKEF